MKVPKVSETIGSILQNCIVLNGLPPEATLTTTETTTSTAKGVSIIIRGRKSGKICKMEMISY